MLRCVARPPAPAAALACAALLLGTLLAGWLAGCGEREGARPPAAPAAPASDTGEVALRTWQGFYQQQKDRIPEPLVNNPGEPWGDYLGSRACAPCHADEFRRWRQSFHSRTFYSAVQGTVLAPFDGREIDAPALDRVTRREIPSPYIARVSTEVDAAGHTRFYMHLRERTEAEGWPRGRSRDTYAGGKRDMPPVGAGTRQEVLYAFGNRRHQPFIARWDAPGDAEHDGKHYVLPFYWNDAEQQWMYDGFRPYVESCAQCHVTGIKTTLQGQPGQPALGMTTGPARYNPPPHEEGWAEGAVGCETCHGPGGPHVAAVNHAGIERYRELRRTGQKPPSIFPSTKGSDTKQRLTQQCDSCHNFHTESSVTFVPGPGGYGRDAIHKPLRPQDDPHHVQHYPDGSKKSPCSVGHVYRQSKMWHADLHCFDCHDPHGSEHFASLKASVRDNSLCIECHVDMASPEAQARHGRHQPGSPGNLCVECHMPRHMIFTNGEQHMSDLLFSHIFSVPRGGARPGAPPTSCNICHVDRDEAWSEREIRAGWQAEREERAARKAQEAAGAARTPGAGQPPAPGQPPGPGQPR